MKYLTSGNNISAIKRTLVVTLWLILSSAVLAPVYAKILTTRDGGRYVGYSEAYTKRVDLGLQNDQLSFTLND